MIYCNNNFANEQKKPAIQSKMVELALNIPTFINLYGYDYKNIYELSENLKVTDGSMKIIKIFYRLAGRITRGYTNHTTRENPAEG